MHTDMAEKTEETREQEEKNMSKNKRPNPGNGEMTRRELKSRRTGSTKTFENSDHSFTTEIYLSPVHYQTEDGSWEEMDDTLEAVETQAVALNGAADETADVESQPEKNTPDEQENAAQAAPAFLNRKGRWQATFAASADSESAITIRDGSHTIAWHLEQAAPSEACRKDTQVLVYPEILPGIDAEYHTAGQAVKENLILKGAAQVPEQFSFLYHAEGLSVLQHGNQVTFEDADGKEVFCFTAPLMLDMAGSRSEQLALHLEEEVAEHTWRITLTPDHSWLRDASRIYPVTVDPITTSSLKREEIEDAHVDNLNYGTNYQNSIYLKTMGGDNIQRSFLKFKLPELKTGDMLVGAHLMMVSLAEDKKSRTVEVHRVKQSWSSATLDWNNRPTCDETVEDRLTYTGDEIKYVTLDITNLVKNWYINGGNYGLMVKDAYEFSGYTEFLSSDCHDGFKEMRPHISLTYMNYSGLEDYWSYHSQDAGRAGAVHVNDCNGNLILIRSDMATGGSLMPMSIAHVYNTNDRTEDVGYGYGFRLNYHQTIAKKTIGTTDYYEYVDADGTKCYFYYDKEKKEWKDELGKEMTLKVNGDTSKEPYVIESKDHSRMVFGRAGHLIHIIDQNANQISVTFGKGDGKITAVTDGAGRVAKLAYFTDADGKQTRVKTLTAPDGRVWSFAYTDGKLTTVTDPDGKKSTYAYDTRKMLTSVKNFDGYELRYTYDTRNPYRVKKIAEYAGETAGKSLSLTYGYNSTKFTDNKGRKEIYRFDNNGTLTHIHDGYGHALGARFNRSGNHVNCLENTTKLQSNIVQLLKDPIIQAATCGWKSSATDHDVMKMTVNTNADYVKTGTRSLCVAGSDKTAVGMWYQDVTVKKGQSYTFSMHTRLDKTDMADDGFACLRVRYEDKDGNAVNTDSEHLTAATSGFVRLAATVTVPEDAKTDVIRVYLFSRHIKGSFYGDMAQLEPGGTPNRCNLVDNGDFHLGTVSGFSGNGTTRMDGLTTIGASVYRPVQAASMVVTDTAAFQRYPDGDEQYLLERLKKFTHVSVLGRRNDSSGTMWYQVKVKDGRIGYIRAASTVSFAAGGDGIREGIVAVAGEVVRSSYSDSSQPVLEALNRGTRVGICDTKTDANGKKWVRIGISYGKSTRYIGYVPEESVMYVGMNEAYAKVKTAGNLRLEPKSSASSLGAKAAGDGLALRGVVFRKDGSTWYGVMSGQKIAYYPLTQLNVTTEVRYDSIKTTSVKEKIAGLDTHVYKIQGFPEKDKKLTKTLDLGGKKGDTFMVNAWGRGDALPESTDENRRFGVEVVFVGKDKDGKEITDVHYTNFSPDILDWQFLSDVYVAKIEYTSVKVSYTYCRNANLAFFDGLSLFKEGFGQTFAYDKDNNIIAVTDLQNQKQKFEYNDNQDMTGVTDARGNSFKYEYDKNHNVTKGTSAEKCVLRYTYDDKGNVLKSAAVSAEDETTGTWLTRTMTEDQNHVATVKDARGCQVTYDWDTKKDLLNSVKDARSSTTYYTYDGKTERLTSVSKTVKAKGQDQEVKVEYGYSNDHLTRITHNGFNYGFGYNEFGKTRLVAVAGSSVVSYEYEEKNGKLLKTKYANGDYLRCEYDTQGRLVKEYYYSAASQKEQLLHYYVYDREGNLYRATDYASGKTYRLSYDFLDRLMRVRDEKGNAYQYTYDANNNMIRLRHEADGTVHTIGYTYDKDSRETKTTLGKVTRETAYDAWGRVKAQDWKNDESQIFHVSYEYPDSGKNIIGLPTKIVNGGVATEYTYDANGNITSVTENKKKVSYVYDGLNRLVRENNELLNKTITYYYDEGGNLREEREYDYTTDPVSGTPKKLTTAVMDETWKDKLLKWGSTGMTYDACGNMLKKGDATFTWTQGRKLSAINNGKNIRYYYDHTGARVKKVVDGVTTEYRMAGSLLVSERTGDETIWYQYDSAASLVAMIIGGTRYNYVRNAQNDIVGLIDSTGKRVVYYKYDSWGRAVNISGTMAATVGQKNPFRYRGYYFDAESGMYYLQSRYYDSEIRRFISADNIIVTGTSVEYQNVNLYEYCLDNPINFQDPSGHFILSALAGAGAYFFEAIVSLGASYLLTKEIAGVVDEFAWYRKSQKEKRDEALLSRVITRDLLKQDYDYWTAELKKINGKKQVVGGEPLTVEEACLRVSQLKSVMCRNKSAAWHIIIVNRYFNAVKPERHGDEAYSHFHPIRNPTGYPSVHIWFFD